MQLTWYDRAFAELSPAQLYAIVQLRERVFIVEQRCIYLDADGLDLQARHLWAQRGDELVAYLRLVPAGARFFEISIGRVIIAPQARRAGLGQELMRRGIAAAGPVAIRISAQAHLESFYADLGFERASELYDEDGIPHLEMLRPASL